MEIVTEIEKIKNKFDSSYHHHPIFMYYNKKQYPVKVISISGNSVIIKSLSRHDKENRILTVIENGKLHVFTFEFQGSKDHFEILHPVALEIVPAHSLLNKKNPERLYITNIVNQADLLKTLVANNDKTNLIQKEFTEKIKDKVSSLEIFIHERVDVRLNLLNKFNKYIFIPDKLNPDCVKDEYIPYIEYIHQVKYIKELDDNISEITVPLKFKDLFTYGYLSLHNKTPMTEDHLEFIENLSKHIKKAIFSHAIINESLEASIIIEVNSKEFTIIHSNTKHFSKIFSIGEIIIFELCCSPELKINTRATVRGIEATESHYKVHCQFLFIDEDNSKYITDFLKEHIPHLEEQN